MNSTQSLKSLLGRAFAATAFVAIALVATLEVSLAQDATTPAEVAEPIKVMSFNIRNGKAKDGENHWEKRDYLLAETIRMFDPDLLGTQEVYDFQGKYLQESLPEYGFHGVGRNDGKTEGEYVPIMYKKDRFQVSDSGHFWLSETPNVPGSKSWDTSLTRMASWVQLSDLKNDGAKIMFVNTHFDHQGQIARLESMRLIRKRAEKFMAKGIPFIIVGDFNTTEDRQPYAEMTSGNKGNTVPIFDSFRQANPERSPNESSSTRWVGNREGTRIDWILHSQEFKTLQSVINYTHDAGRYPSDHYPVQAILRLKN